MRVPLLFTATLVLFLSGQGLSGQVRINEVMAYNITCLANPLTGEQDDWIELYNGTDRTVDFGQFYLTDNPSDPTKWRIPEGMEVPAGGFLLVWADGTGNLPNKCHAPFKLAVEGETVALFSAAGTLVDSLCFPRLYGDISYGIHSDGSPVHFKTPTPGRWNLGGAVFTVAKKPRFDPPAGIYPSGRQVALLDGDTGGTIRYTLDGTEPDEDDPLYTGPITVESHRVIRARQWVEGQEPSEIATASYIISDGFTLPVISLVTDPDNFFDDMRGIYVTGTNGVPGYCNDEPQNWNQDWERPMSLEYFDRDGNHRLQVDGGVKIHGGCSRNAPMKSLGFFARNRYGSSAIGYPLFREKEADRFEGLILRNGGNDFWHSFIRDAVVQATANTAVMDLDHQAYEPVQVFLNGEYWGIHNLREKVNEHWVTSNYGIPDDQVDFLKNSWEVFAGSREGFDELTRYLEEHSLAPDENFRVVADQIDMDSYTDYLITQMYFANRDWPGNNQKYWRERTGGGKWRWILFDTEFSMGLYNQDATMDMFSFVNTDTVYEWPNPAWATLMIRRLLENRGFREGFLQKYMMHLNTTFTPDHLIGVIDSLYGAIHDLFPAQIARWGNAGTMEGWESKVEELRIFARNRPGYVWHNMREFYSLGPLFTLLVTSGDRTGQAFLNHLPVPPGEFEGKFAGGVDRELEFRAAPGYRFSHWEAVAINSAETLLLPRNSNWRYNDSGSYPGDGWTSAGFDDSAWPAGPGELGYGDGNEATVVGYGPDEENKYITTYFRSDFHVDDLQNIDSCVVRLMRDDGGVVYLNGAEVLRVNMPTGAIGPETTTVTWVGDADESAYFGYSVDPLHLQEGLNTVAVEIHQTGPTSSDISFDLELAVTRKLSQGGDTLIYEDNPFSVPPESSLWIWPVTTTDNRDADLLINEVMASNQGAYTDEWGNDGDWIEVYNRGENDVDMAGFFFTDELEEPGKWMIPGEDPPATTIPSRGHLVFFADGNPPAGPLHLGFKLSASGEAVGLSYFSGTETVWIDTLRFGALAPNLSFGRYPDGAEEWVSMEQFTPGEPNFYSTVFAGQERLLEIKLYPNPARELLNYRIKGSGSMPAGGFTLVVVDLTGRVMLREPGSFTEGEITGSLDVSSLPEGIYMLVIGSGSGNHVLRFVKAGT